MKFLNFYRVFFLLIFLSVTIFPYSSSAHPTQKMATFFTHVNRSCESFLTESTSENFRKVLKVLGHIVPVIPLSKTLANSDQLFFVLIESPLIGAITTPVSNVLSHLLRTGGVHLGMPFLVDTAQVYASYQSAGVVRKGVALQEGLNPKLRIILNWWYSFALYAMNTAGYALAHAQTHEQKVYAYSLVAFSALWPVFSQTMDVRVITPFLFSKFPTQSLLKKIQDPSIPLATLVDEQNAKIQELEQKLVDEQEFLQDGKAIKSNIKNQLASEKARLYWIEWFRRGTQDGDSISQSRKNLYWARKTMSSMALVAIPMTTGYFLLRWLLVGNEPDSDRLGIQKVIDLLLVP